MVCQHFVVFSCPLSCSQLFSCPSGTGVTFVSRLVTAMHSEPRSAPPLPSPSLLQYKGAHVKPGFAEHFYSNPGRYKGRENMLVSRPHFLRGRPNVKTCTCFSLLLCSSLTNLSACASVCRCSTMTPSRTLWAECRRPTSTASSSSTPASTQTSGFI